MRNISIFLGYVQRSKKKAIAHHRSNDILCIPFSMHISFNREHNSKYRKISFEFFNGTFHLALASPTFFFNVFICSFSGELSFAWKRIGAKLNHIINAISTTDGMNHSFGTSPRNVNSEANV